MLLAVDLYEDFIEVESVAVSSVFSFQSAGINGAEFDAPKADGLSADGDASFGEEVFDIPMAEVEAIVEPDGIGNDVGWESVSFISIHSPILPVSAL